MTNAEFYRDSYQMAAFCFDSWCEDMLGRDAYICHNSGACRICHDRWYTLDFDERAHQAALAKAREAGIIFQNNRDSERDVDAVLKDEAAQCLRTAREKGWRSWGEYRANHYMTKAEAEQDRVRRAQEEARRVQACQAEERHLAAVAAEQQRMQAAVRAQAQQTQPSPKPTAVVQPEPAASIPKTPRRRVAGPAKLRAPRRKPEDSRIREKKSVGRPRKTAVKAGESEKKA